MNKSRLLFLSAGFLGAAIFLIAKPDAKTATTSAVQSDSGKATAVVIDTGTGALGPRKHNDRFERVGIKPGRIATVTVQFSDSMAGKRVEVAAVDGGAVFVSGGGTVISSDGTLAFQFQAPASPGACRILLHSSDSGGDIIQFWVRDPNNPQNDPQLFPGS